MSSLGCRGFLHLLHHTKEIATPNEAEVRFAKVLAQETTGKVNEFGSRGQSWYAAIAIEICANANMLDTCDVNHVAKVCYGIEYGGLSVSAEETIVEGYLCYAATGCQSPQLVVGKVARMVAKGSTGRMGAYNGRRTDVDGIVEAAFAGVR